MDMPAQEPWLASVLVVDDEPLIRWSVGERLRGDAVRVFDAGSLAQARTIFAVEPVDLVVLDIRLPDGNGVDLLQDFIRERPGLPVIMISAHGDDETEQTVVASGALCLVHKPFDVDTLAAAVEAALSVARAIPG